MGGSRMLRRWVAVCSVVAGLPLVAAVFPGSAGAVSCVADVSGGGPSGWFLNSTYGSVDDGFLLTNGLDGVRDNAFDGPRTAVVNAADYMNPNPDGCSRVLDGRGVNFPPAVADGIRVRPKLYFPAGRAFARTLILLTNPGPGPADIQYSIDANPGSDAATRIGTTSSGDRIVDTADAWATTCEDEQNDGCAGTGGADANRDPELALIWERQGQKPDSADLFELADGLDDYDARFNNVHIDPGETVAFMDIEMLAPTIARADRFAHRAATHPRRLGLFDGMTTRARSELRNW